MPRTCLIFSCLLWACALIAFFGTEPRAGEAPCAPDRLQGRAAYAHRLAAELAFRAQTERRLADANLPGLAPDGGAASAGEFAALLRDVRCQPALSARLAALLVGGKEFREQRRRAFLQIQEAVDGLRRLSFVGRLAMDRALDPASDQAFAALTSWEKLREARFCFLLHLWAALGANSDDGRAFLPLDEGQLDWLWERKTSWREMTDLGRVAREEKAVFASRADLAAALLNPEAWRAGRRDEKLQDRFRSVLSPGWGVAIDDLLPEAAGALLRPGTRPFIASGGQPASSVSAVEGAQGNGLRLRRLLLPPHKNDAARGPVPLPANMALTQGERLFALWGMQPENALTGGLQGAVPLWRGTPLSRLAAVGPLLQPWDRDKASCERTTLSGTRLLVASTRPVHEVAAHLGWLSALRAPASFLPATGRSSGILAVTCLEQLFPSMALAGGKEEADLLFGPLTRVWIYRPGSEQEGAYWLEMARHGAPRPPCVLGESPLLSFSEQASAQAALYLRRDVLRRQLAEFALERLAAARSSRAPGDAALPLLTEAEADAVAARFAPFADGEIPPLQGLGACLLGYLLLGGREEDFAKVQEILGQEALPLESRLNACRRWASPLLEKRRAAAP